MCLDISKSTKQKIATEDIIVYKGLLCDKDECYTTPFQKTVIKIGKTYKSKLVRNNCIFNDEIEEGLHSYKSFNITSKFYYVVAKCIIPKGSKYYQGTFFHWMDNKTRVSFASDTLKYVEIVKNDIEK